MDKFCKEDVEDILPLMPIQEGMLFHYLNEPDKMLYFEQVSLRLTGNIMPIEVKKAWNVVVEANELLRTVFVWRNVKKPIQIVLKNLELPINEYNLTNSDYENIDAILNKVRMDDRKNKIDISTNPFRITLCKLRENEYEIILSSYHIVFDGWSLGIILKEFIQAYECMTKGKKQTIIAKSKYKDYIKWHQNIDKSKSADYWKNYLRGFENKTVLPGYKNRYKKSIWR